MSLKVYNAYRLRKGVDLWAFVRDIRPKGEAAVKAAARAVYSATMAEVDSSSAAFASALTRYETRDRARVAVARDTICNGYKAQLASPMRNGFDLDVSIAFREYCGRIYVIKHCAMAMRRCLDFLDNDPRLKEYHYQNSSDRPDEIPVRDWNERRRAWSAMTDRDPWRNVLALTLCSWSTWYLIDPWTDIMGKLPAEETP